MHTSLRGQHSSCSSKRLLLSVGCIYIKNCKEIFIHPLPSKRKAANVINTPFYLIAYFSPGLNASDLNLISGNSPILAAMCSLPGFY